MPCLFHPEVHESEYGKDHSEPVSYFDICEAKIVGRWQDSLKSKSRKSVQVGDRKVLCALSGGVDSSVVAALIDRAIGDQLTCIFVDHGLLRKGEVDSVVDTFSDKFNMNFIKVDAQNVSWTS